MSRSPINLKKKMLDKKTSQTAKSVAKEENTTTKTTPVAAAKPRDIKTGQEAFSGPVNKAGPFLGSNDEASVFHHKPAKQPPNPRSLSIAMVGAPNAGKSTIVNWIVNDQVSAISPKAQTTRDRMLGILTEGDTQLLFYDTPGIVPSSARSKTVQQIVTAAWEALDDADIIVFIVDAARSLDENVTHIIQQLETNLAGVRKHLGLTRPDSGSAEPSKADSPLEGATEKTGKDKATEATEKTDGEGNKEGDASTNKVTKNKEAKDLKLHKPVNKKCILVLNKTDLVHPQERLLRKTEKLNESGLFVETFFTSAINGDRVDEVKDYLISQAVDRPWTFDAETTTDLTPMQRVNEVIREKVFSRLNQELPYVVKQQNIGWTVLPDGALRIDQRLVVPKLSQRVIILGKAGALLKQLTTAAAKDLEAIFQRKVYLNLMVQEKKNYHEYDYT